MPQVVLPHPKKKEEDKVVFLEDRFAAGDNFEAEQRGVRPGRVRELSAASIRLLQ